MKRKLGRLLDWLTTLSALALFIPGLGAQAYLNWSRGTTEGLDASFVHLLLLNTGLWLLWGIGRKLWPVIIANAFGAAFALIIVWQYYCYPRF
ncbi:hypothetical protein A2V68_00460 [candidate division Kazan bacterium RBG_13_50_9]|uniref:Uncharacterized protein n=1 Tax=candidate division Kazan bacterium RBG_13_50_9 TaxID=1798535 RepID=A0A1F4NSJ5_UNCK3|nr:MAG: hypothetical protein A2V68_00460 [candidate division Kazan bacterium RBG_13_50_9]